MKSLILIFSLIDLMVKASTNRIAPLLENADITEGAYRDLDCQIELPKDKIIPSYLSGSLYRTGPAYWDPSLNVHQNNTHSHLWFGLGMVHVFHFNEYHTNNKISYRGEFQQSGGYENFFDGETDKLLSPNNQVTIRRLTEPDGNNVLMVGGGFTLSNSFDPETVKIDQTPYQFTDLRAKWPLIHYKITFGHSPSHEHVDLDGTVFNYINVVEETLSSSPRGYYQLYHIKPGTTERIFAENKIYPNPVGGGQPLFAQSFGLTANYIIICEIPYLMTPDIDVTSLADLSIANLKTTLEYLGDNGELNYVTWYVVDKYSGELQEKFISDLFTYYHFGNSYEHIDDDGNIQIIVDLVIYDSEDKTNIYQFDTAYIETMLNPNHDDIAADCNARYARFVLPMNEDGAATNSRIEYQELSVFRGIEFPMLSYEDYNTQQYEYVYFNGFGHCNDNTETEMYRIWDKLIKQRLPIYPSTTTYDAVIYSKENHYFQEPVFVPDPDGEDEDDGVVLSLGFDSNIDESYLLILDAKTFEEIAIIRPNLDRAIPFTFHGRYYESIINDVF